MATVVPSAHCLPTPDLMVLFHQEEVCSSSGSVCFASSGMRSGKQSETPTVT